MSVSFPLQSTLLIKFGPMPLPNVAFETPIPFLKKLLINRMKCGRKIIMISDYLLS